MPKTVAALVLTMVMSSVRAQDQSVSSAYGTPCSSAADCTSPAYPHCYVYWKDQTLGKNTVSYNDPSPKPSAAAVKGVCVECVSSCDCPVNQYCGIGDIKVSKEMSSNGGTAGQTSEVDYKRLMKEMELFGSAFEGLPIRSRCLDYEKPKEHCSVHVKNTLATQVVEQKSDEGKTVPIYRSSEGLVSEKLAPRFCGKVNSWAPAFLTCLVSGGLSQDISRCAQGPTDSDLSTGDVASTAAVCPKWAGYRDSSIGEVFASPPCLPGDAVMGGGGYSFVSPAIDWQGVCVRGACAICLEGEKRCTASSEAGTPQVCLDGAWVAERGNGMQASDLGASQLRFNVAAQAEVTSAVFAGLCFALLFINAAGVWLSFKKDEEEREDRRFEKHLNELAGGVGGEGEAVAVGSGSGGGSNRVSPEPHFEVADKKQGLQAASSPDGAPTRAKASIRQ